MWILIRKDIFFSILYVNDTRDVGYPDPLKIIAYNL